MDLDRRTASDKKFRHKAFSIAKNPKFDGYLRGLASMVNAFLLDSDIKNENMSDQQLIKELRKTIIRKFEERKVYSHFIENIWSADLADMQLISKLNKGFRFLLCVIDIYN